MRISDWSSDVCSSDLVDTTFPYYQDVSEADDLPAIVKQQIEHFFTHYKDLEPEKWVRVGTWGGREDARRFILERLERAKAANGKGGYVPFVLIVGEAGRH